MVHCSLNMAIIKNDKEYVNDLLSNTSFDHLITAIDYNKIDIFKILLKHLNDDYWHVQLFQYIMIQTGINYWEFIDYLMFHSKMTREFVFQSNHISLPYKVAWEKHFEDEMIEAFDNASLAKQLVHSPLFGGYVNHNIDLMVHILSFTEIPTKAIKYGSGNKENKFKRLVS